MNLLEGKSVSVSYGDITILHNASFVLEEGRWLMVIGPNGAGKSTLVNAVSQGVRYSGDILFRGRNLKEYKPKEIARHIGVLAQKYAVGYAFRVEEVVRLGRYSHSSGLFGGRSDQDELAVEEALELTGLKSIRSQSVLTLSGGELQRTFLAQLFAQNPDVLMLDEPTNHLDLVFQKQIFTLISDWLQKPGRAVLSVVHDLSLAKAYGTDALLLHRGETLASGPIGRVMTAETLAKAYRMDVCGWMRQMLSQWEEKEK